MKKRETPNILGTSPLITNNNTSGLHVIVWILLPLVIFVVWFGWKSYEQSRTQWMESKVKNALNQSMQSLSVSLPRIQITDRNSGEVYYAPDLNAQLHAFDLYGQTLINLNQDISVPVLKLTLVSMTEEYSSSDTILQGQAAVEFPLIAGIDKKMIVRESIQVPHFQNPN
jgi:hypothetical protein